jgi:fatty acid desaturase
MAGVKLKPLDYASPRPEQNPRSKLSGLRMILLLAGLWAIFAMILMAYIFVIFAQKTGK